MYFEPIDSLLNRPIKITHRNFAKVYMSKEGFGKCYRYYGYYPIQKINGHSMTAGVALRCQNLQLHRLIVVTVIHFNPRLWQDNSRVPTRHCRCYVYVRSFYALSCSLPLLLNLFLRRELTKKLKNCMCGPYGRYQPALVVKSGGEGFVVRSIRSFVVRWFVVFVCSSLVVGCFPSALRSKGSLAAAHERLQRWRSFSCVRGRNPCYTVTWPNDPTTNVRANFHRRIFVLFQSCRRTQKKLPWPPVVADLG